MNSAQGRTAQVGQYCSKASVFAQAEKKIPAWHLLLQGSPNLRSSVLLSTRCSLLAPTKHNIPPNTGSNSRRRKALKVLCSEASQSLAGVARIITYYIKYFLPLSISSGASCASTKQRWRQIPLSGNRHVKARPFQPIAPFIQCGTRCLISYLAIMHQLTNS